MSRLLVQIIASMLLLLQALVGVAPGRVLCLPLADCGSHEATPTCDRGGCSSDNHDTHALPCREHRHTPVEHALHPDADCGCHIHVPVPSDEQLPTHPTRAELTEQRWAAAPIATSVVLASNWAPPRRSFAIGPPPDLSLTDQVLTLKATRLLI